MRARAEIAGSRTDRWDETRKCRAAPPRPRVCISTTVPSGNCVDQACTTRGLAAQRQASAKRWKQPDRGVGRLGPHERFRFLAPLAAHERNGGDDSAVQPDCLAGRSARALSRLRCRRVDERSGDQGITRGGDARRMLCHDLDRQGQPSRAIASPESERPHRRRVSRHTPAPVHRQRALVAGVLVSPAIGDERVRLASTLRSPAWRGLRGAAVRGPLLDQTEAGSCPRSAHSRARPRVLRRPSMSPEARLAQRRASLRPYLCAADATGRADRCRRSARSWGADAIASRRADHA